MAVEGFFGLTCAIVGAGSAGTLLVSNLVRQSKKIPLMTPLKIYLIEKKVFAQGVAYSTQCPLHLLNIPAQFMNPILDDENHFIRWAQEKDKNTGPNTFVPRMIFGQYLQELLKQAELDQNDKCSFEKIHGEAVSLEKKSNSFRLLLKEGREIEADSVVLAMGNFPPPPPPLKNKWFINHPHYFGNPYQRTYSKDEDIFILGTGLSMVDQVLQMQAQGHKGKIHALSRHGFLPFLEIPKMEKNMGLQPQEDFSHLQTAKAWLRFIRLKVKEGDLITLRNARNYIRSNWFTFSQNEKSRYFRYLNSYANLLFHGIPEIIHDQLQELIKKKKFFIHAGRLTEIREGFEVIYRPRYRKIKKRLKVDAIINCLSPGKRFFEIEDPFLYSLAEKKLVSLNADHMLLNRSPSFQAIDSDGTEIERLFVLGSLSKTIFDSAISIPVIARQTYRLANQFLSDCILKEYT